MVFCVLRWYSPNRSPNYPALGKSYHGFTLLLDFALLIERGTTVQSVQWDVCCSFATQLRCQDRCIVCVCLCVFNSVWLPALHVGYMCEYDGI